MHRPQINQKKNKQSNQILKPIKDHGTTIAMGEFSAKVKREGTQDVTGSWGLGERNIRGNRLI